MIKEIDPRSGEILRHIVELYCQTGEPVGSKTISQFLNIPLSPATIRNIMSALEDVGCLYSPHTSAGRIPTPAGLRFFVNDLIDYQNIDNYPILCEQSVDELGHEVTSSLTSILNCVSIFMAPKRQCFINQIEFIKLSPNRALVVLVTSDGDVENRVITFSHNVEQDELIRISNYLSSKVYGKTLTQAKLMIARELAESKFELSLLAKDIAMNGLDMLSSILSEEKLYIKGKTTLIKEADKPQDFQKLRDLLDALEEKEKINSLLNATIEAKCIQIYIGSENQQEELSESSVVCAPYSDSSNNVVGAIGVIGPLWMPYSKVLPVIEKTADAISRILK